MPYKLFMLNAFIRFIRTGTQTEPDLDAIRHVGSTTTIDDFKAEHSSDSNSLKCQKNPKPITRDADMKN